VEGQTVTDERWTPPPDTWVTRFGDLDETHEYQLAADGYWFGIEFLLDDPDLIVLARMKPDPPVTIELSREDAEWLAMTPSQQWSESVPGQLGRISDAARKALDP
jgi:hypothetical protein